jgi:hypothetical protein
MVSVIDPYGRILGFQDRICCVNPIDNTHYAPITTPSTRTKYFTRTLAQNTSLRHKHVTEFGLPFRQKYLVYVVQHDERETPFP